MCSKSKCNIIKEIERELLEVFPGNLHLFFDDEINKWHFVVLDENLFFEHRFGIVHELDIKYRDSDDCFAIGWDILREFQDFKGVGCEADQG
jgi:hypothetical protein